jgi:hypothetical protein
MTNKLEILSAAVEQRRQEVMHYQINIDNYRAAIAELDENYSDRAEMAPFREQLRELLRTSLIEQTKEKILLTVIERQVQELGGGNVG